MSNYYNRQYPSGPGYYPSDTRLDVDDDDRRSTEKKPRWNWCTHGCSIFTMVCCGWCAFFSSLFGLIALVFSLGSYTDYRLGDYDRYKYKKSCALGWMLIGMIFGAGALAAMIYFGYTYSTYLVQYWANLYPQAAT